jgi:hypothetical protein
MPKLMQADRPSSREPAQLAHPPHAGTDQEGRPEGNATARLGLTGRAEGIACLANREGANAVSEALARAGSRLVMDLLQPVDRRRDALKARLELQRQKL